MTNSPRPHLLGTVLTTDSHGVELLTENVSSFQTTITALQSPSKYQFQMSNLSSTQSISLPKMMAV